MALTKLTTDLIDGSLGTDWQTAVKTAAFTATAGEGYFVNTTSAAITVTLPSSPSSGDEVNLVDYAGTADTNNITITSSDNINGASNDVLINYERGGVSIVYVDATQGWIAYNAANETAGALRLPPFDVDYLVVAGGGGGGGAFGGGGGAGGYRNSYNSETSGGGASSETALSLNTSTNYTVTVGSGGTGGTGSASSRGTEGTNSVFSSVTSTGGGTGGGYFPSSGSSSFTPGTSGGSGGGAGNPEGTTTWSGGAGTANQGYAGGNAQGQTPYVGGGGGGAGAAGANGVSSGGNGGNGLASSITGNSVTRAGGGGGGAYTYSDGSLPGSGGSGGGGNGNGAQNGNGVAGSLNTGSGGGGSGYPELGVGGSGGSGVVIIRYPGAYTVTIGSGLTGSTATDGSDKVTTFTAGTGNISFS